MKRLAWVDNLRIMVIITVVFLHSAVTYSGLGGWYYKENDGVDMLSMIFFAFFQTFTQAYFMSLLFMVSGYFTRASLEKKSSWPFISGRIKRLGIPLLIFVFLLHPLSVKLANPDIDIWSWYLDGISNLRFFSWTGPLWFVEALLIFTLFYVLIYKIFSRFLLKISFRLNIVNVTVLILVISLLAFILRLFYPIGTDFYNLQFGFFSAYIVMFAFGIIAYSSGIFDKISFMDGKRWLLISLGIGIPAWFLIIFLGGPLDGIMLIEGGMNWPAFFYALWESFFCVTFILALVGLFKYKLDISGRVQKFLSDNAFGVFVFHAPILIGISMIFRDVGMQPVLKFFVIAVIAVTASFSASWTIRRVKVLRRFFS